MANSPVKNSSGVVTTTVYVENEVVKCNFSLQNLYIHLEANRIGYATLVFQSGSVASQNIPESEDSAFTPGKKLRIEAPDIPAKRLFFLKD
ncbi:MAG: hypothetical protein LIP01_14270 [Tannerellaceae bacterium]|nr:hypothetical protein [Tannerellaceae bacterium]